jgi:hypothetical protein
MASSLAQSRISNLQNHLSPLEANNKVSVLSNVLRLFPILIYFLLTTSFEAAQESGQDFSPSI